MQEKRLAADVVVPQELLLLLLLPVQPPHVMGDWMDSRMDGEAGEGTDVTGTDVDAADVSATATATAMGGDGARETRRPCPFRPWSLLRHRLRLRLIRLKVAQADATTDRNGEVIADWAWMHRMVRSAVEYCIGAIPATWLCDPRSSLQLSRPTSKASCLPCVPSQIGVGDATV